MFQFHIPGIVSINFINTVCAPYFGNNMPFQSYQTMQDSVKVSILENSLFLFILAGIQLIIIKYAALIEIDLIFMTYSNTQSSLMATSVCDYLNIQLINIIVSEC